MSVTTNIFSESQLLDSADDLFSGDCTSIDPSDLDIRLWQLVYDWTGIHNGFYALASRCCASLILNSTRERINIQNISLKEGRNFKCFGKEGYEAEARSIIPGGYVVIFAYGFTPSIIDSAQVKIGVPTTAFTLTACTKPSQTSCSSLSGY